MCIGSGETIPSPCTVCNGQKQIQQQRTLNVKIPPGVDNDTQIRLSGEGTPGIDGGPPGNLFVVLHVEKHEYFRRRGDDILLEMEINVAQAALGDEIKVPTVDGEETLIIPAGTQSGTVFPLRGRGVPHLRRSGRGDQLVITHVAVPKKMTPEQREAAYKGQNNTAERVGFEPTVAQIPQRFSRPPQSSTLAPLRRSASDYTKEPQVCFVITVCTG